MLILAVLIFISVGLIIGNLKVKQKREILYQKMEKVKKEMEKLSHQNELLQSEISKKQTQDYLEKVAREDLNLKKEGEKVVAFPILEKEEKEEESEKQSLWQKFLEKFKIK
jgi:cell division protein FtsB